MAAFFFFLHILHAVLSQTRRHNMFFTRELHWKSQKCTKKIKKKTKQKNKTDHPPDWCRKHSLAFQDSDGVHSILLSLYSDNSMQGDSI